MPMINKRIHPWFSALAIAGAVVFISWGAPSLQTDLPVQVYPAPVDPQISNAPVAPSQSVVANAIDDPAQGATQTQNVAIEQSAKTTTSNATDRIDPNLFFPPGHGHELARESCLTCHQLIIFAQVRMTRDRWMHNRANHVSRLSELSAGQIEIIYEYLTATLNPDLPIPNIPLVWVCPS